MSNTSLICPKCGSDEIFTKGEVCLCSDCGARFAAAPKPFRAMKLFLSYGHPEQVICARIADALRRSGRLKKTKKKQTDGTDPTLPL